MYFILIYDTFLFTFKSAFYVVLKCLLFHKTHTHTAESVADSFTLITQLMDCSEIFQVKLYK